MENIISRLTNNNTQTNNVETNNAEITTQTPPQSRAGLTSDEDLFHTIILEIIIVHTRHRHTFQILLPIMKLKYLLFLHLLNLLNTIQLITLSMIFTMISTQTTEYLSEDDPFLYPSTQAYHPHSHQLLTLMQPLPSFHLYTIKLITSSTTL